MEVSAEITYMTSKNGLEQEVIEVNFVWSKICLPLYWSLLWLSHPA